MEVDPLLFDLIFCSDGKLCRDESFCKASDPLILKLAFVRLLCRLHKIEKPSFHVTIQLSSQAKISSLTEIRHEDHIPNILIHAYAHALQ